MNKFEQSLWADGFRAVAGIDEAGRGPLAGPVVAAAVVFDPWGEVPAGIDDSKKLSPKTREVLYDKIYACARSVGIGIVYQQEIDAINILQATFKAMKSAVSQLSVSPDHLLIDGNMAPDFDQPYTTIVKGDSQSFSIAAASIIAKVTRDRIMVELDAEYPQYGFKSNKGYATQKHINAIKMHGLTCHHRVKFCRRIVAPQMRMFY